MTFTGTLLPYQPEAVDKMCERGSMLVAYDLGLGKTVLTIAAIERLMDDGSIKEPGLIIALSSLKYQWADSIKKFSDSTPLVIDGTKKQREKQYEEAMKWRETGVDYVVLNYEQVVNDWALVSRLPRGFVVLDEATAVKSFRAKRSKQVKKLDSPYRFALTGTPIENGKPEELFSIMQFVDSSVLGRFDLFDKTFIVRNDFGGVSRYRNLHVLHKVMQTASVRKSQSDPDVSPFLPESIHLPPMRVPFDRASAGLYERIAEDLLRDLDEAKEMFGGNFNIFQHYGVESDQGGPMDQLRGRLMAKITAMRMLCNHPELLLISAMEFARGYGEVTESKEGWYRNSSSGGSEYAHDLWQEGLLTDLTKTPKLDALVSYIGDFLETDPNNKAVVFSVFVPTLEMISRRLEKYKPLKYSGQMSAKQKEAAKVAFQSNIENKLLVSSDAGGYGVDLPQANLLINYDLPWSSGTATQRNGRIKRASSEWERVVIQDILIRGSIEERQFEMLQQKNSVAAAIIDGEGIDSKGGLSMSLGSLREFLLDHTV